MFEPYYVLDLIHRFEKAISIRLSQSTKDLDMNRPTLNAATVEETNTIPDTITKSPAKKEEEACVIRSPVEASNPPKELSVGSDPKDLTMEGLLLGLRRKKDLHFGNITHPKWKCNKPVVNKVTMHYNFTTLYNSHSFHSKFHHSINSSC